MPRSATGALDAVILNTLATLHPDTEREELVLPAYTVKALAREIGYSLAATRNALATLLIGGFVITRTHRPSGETLYKLPDHTKATWEWRGSIA